MTSLTNCEFGCTGTLTIDGYSLNSYAWDLPNLVKLWAEASVRGENRKMPGASGVRSNPTRLDEYDVSLPFWITGLVAPNGTPYVVTPWAGLETNLNLLWLNVFQPVTTGRGDRAGVLTLPSGTVRTARVQIDPIEFPQEPYDAYSVECTVNLKVVSGRFA